MLSIGTGLAWGLSNPELEYAGRVCGHDGGTIGYVSVMRYDTVNNVAIVTYMNRLNDDARRYEILYEIAYSTKRILGYEVPKWSTEIVW